MPKTIAVLSTMLIVVSAGKTVAEEPHTTYWKYFVGEWHYEITELGAKGTATWWLAAKGNALVGRFEEEDGNAGVEVAGYRADAKSMVINGYGSQGNRWSLELKLVSADRAEGTNCGVLPDGRTYKGDFKEKIIDKDHFEWTFEGKTGDGKDLTISGKYSRKAK